MNFLRTAIAALVLLITSPVTAQWQTPNHSVPTGRGAGVQGFGSVAQPSLPGLPFVSGGPSADSTWGTVTGPSTNFATADNTFKTPATCPIWNSNGTLGTTGAGCGANSNTPHTQDFLAGADFTPGTTTTLTLSAPPTSTDLLVIFFDGINQSKNTWAVSLSTGVVTFNAAIPTNTQVVEAKWSTSATLAGVGSITVDANTPQFGSLTLTSGSGVQLSTSGQNINVATTYTPPGTGGQAQSVATELQRIGLYANDYGAICTGGGDDHIAFQNMINEVEVLSGNGTPVLAKFSGTCVVTTGLVQSGAYVLDLSGATPASTLYGSPSINIIIVNTTAAIFMHDMGLGYISAANPGTSGILVTAPFGFENGGSQFYRIYMQSNFNNSIDFVKASVWKLYKSILSGVNPIIVANFNVADSGDSTIDDVLLNVSNGGAGVVWNSSSGLHFINSKINGTNIGSGFQLALAVGANFTGSISGSTLTVTGSVTGAQLTTGMTVLGSGVTPAFITAFGTGTGGAGTYILSSSQTVGSEAMTTFVNLADLFIQGNSIEAIGTGGAAIELDRATNGPGTVGNVGTINITHNELGAGAYCVHAPTATTQWMDSITIANNTCLIPTVAAYAIDSAQNVSITGGTIHSGAFKFLIGTGVTNAYLGPIPSIGGALLGTVNGAVVDDPTGTVNFSQLPGAAADGSRVYITNGTPGSSPCSAGGTGSTAIRQNGAWKCF